MTDGQKDEKLVIKKGVFYGGIFIGLAALLILSVLTQGFWIIKTPAEDVSSDSNYKAELAEPAGSNQPEGEKTGIVSLMDDDMKLGSDSAPVVIVEFSDFQCSFCRKFWIDTYQQIKTDYIDTGKVQLVYRDYPLNFHPAAQKSAEAVECADDQGKGWEMHDKLYGEQNKRGQSTIQYSTNDIKSWASQIGLDIGEFNDCLDSGRYSQEVQGDINDGNDAGVSGTPSFRIGKRGGYEIVSVSGAQPYSIFKSTIDSMLG